MSHTKRKWKKLVCSKCKNIYWTKEGRVSSRCPECGKKHHIAPIFKYMQIAKHEYGLNMVKK